MGIGDSGTELAPADTQGVRSRKTGTQSSAGTPAQALIAGCRHLKWHLADMADVGNLCSQKISKTFTEKYVTSDFEYIS